jgi:hypothetical protein
MAKAFNSAKLPTKKAITYLQKLNGGRPLRQEQALNGGPRSACRPHQ